MMNAKELQDIFYAKSRNSIATDDYEASMVFSTAEDLTDNLMKGNPEHGNARLITAFLSNAAHRNVSEVEKEAWLDCVETATQFFANGGY